jgi:DNA-binding FadR family transcriptional regulator
VERQTLATAVIERIVAFIQTHALGPSDSLPAQQDLASQLGVSRPVLREAMQGLASIGMVEIRPGSGCYVRDPHASDDPAKLVEISTHASALEVLEARMVVEVGLAGMAAERADAEDCARLEAILARLRRAVSRRQPTAHITSDFHRALSRAGHNAVLFRMVEQLTRPRLAQGIRVETSLPDITAGEYDSHLALYQAVCTGRPEVARAAMRKHLEIAHGWEDQIAQLRARAEAELALV